MYHLFETEVRSISALNGEALRYFSIGSFLFATAINILIGYVFAAPPLSQFADGAVRFGIVIIAVIAALLFTLGGWTVYTKSTIIKQIKAETIVKIS